MIFTSTPFLFGLFLFHSPSVLVLHLATKNWVQGGVCQTVELNVGEEEEEGGTFTYGRELSFSAHDATFNIIFIVS